MKQPKQIDKNQTGIAHLLVLVVVLLVAVTGTYMLVRGHADPIGPPVQAHSAPKGLPPPTSSRTREAGPATPLCYPNGYCFSYAGGRQLVPFASGVSVTLSQAQPTLGPGDLHSLMELAVESADGQQIVELGWTVDRVTYKDLLPHLFAYHWINGQGTCYNGCGFVPLKTKTPLNSVVEVGKTGTYRIEYLKNVWMLSYNGHKVGYFPGGLWQHAFSNAGMVQIFGEVSTYPGAQPKSQMGNGLPGTKAGSAVIKNYKLIGTSVPPVLEPYINGTDPTAYTFGLSRPTSLHIGGPGY